MVIQKLDLSSLKHIFSGSQWELLAAGMVVRVLFCRDSGKIALQSQIYHNDHGIPYSIQRCLENCNDRFIGRMRTRFITDEVVGTVDLHYLGIAPNTAADVEALLGDFAELAREWSDLLEDNDPREYAYISFLR